MQIQTWCLPALAGLHERRAQLNTGTKVALTLSHTTQFLLICPGFFLGLIPLVEFRVSAYEQVSLCMDLLSGSLGFRQPSISLGQDGIAISLYSWLLRELLFLPLDPWARELYVRLRLLAPW